MSNESLSAWRRCSKCLRLIWLSSYSLGGASVCAAVLVLSLVAWAFFTVPRGAPPSANQTHLHGPGELAAGITCGITPITVDADGQTLVGGVAASALTSGTNGSHVDFFTNYGQYMQRIHCMPSTAGTPDWVWIWLLVGLNVGIVAAYARIYYFFFRSYLAEEKRDRNRKLMDLAQVFLWCAVCGYVAGMVMFVWPAYRLLAVCLLILNLWSWRFVINLKQISVSMSANRYRRLAAADTLTGLPNRTSIQDLISRSMASIDPAGESTKGFAVLFIDLDQFKRINDSLGHDAGDELLKQVADRLRSQTRQEDTIESGLLEGTTAARLGGDEFVVVLADADTIEAVSTVATRLIRSISKPFDISGHAVRVTPSIGVSIVTDQKADADHVLREADEAMYEAKAAGKACFRVFDQEMQQRAAERLTMEEDLRWALERKQLRLAYQPIIDLEQGNVSAFEALSRWEHPTKGNIPPDQFIEIAEATGLINELGEWVLGAAAAWLRDYRSHHPDRDDLRVQVNVSRRQMQAWGTAGRLETIVRREGMLPSDIVLEATESAFVQDEDVVLNTLDALRAVGFILSLDDFGTGYSTLSNLHRFPIQQLKIDRSFLSSSQAHKEYRGLIHAISSFADSAGLDVVCEGIEEPEQVALLQAMGCRYAQGYYFARPMPSDDALHWLLPDPDHLFDQVSAA